MAKQKQWVPEIYYEDDPDGGISSHIPFISVPEGEEMPRLLFIFESRETGEFEPGLDGDEVPVVEMDLHQYADMAALKQGLTADEYDRVRSVLGLQPMSEAVKAGREITDRVRTAVS